MADTGDKNTSKSDEVFESETPKAQSGGNSSNESGEKSESWLAGTNTWATSLVKSAKEKTLSTLESMKKDLNEFSDTVQNEASTLTNATVNYVKQESQLIQNFVKSPSEDEGKRMEVAKEVTEEKVDTPEVSSASQEKPEGGAFFGIGWVKTIVDSVQKFAGEDTTKNEEDFTEEIRVGIPRKTTLDRCQLLQIQNDERTFLQPPSQNVDLYRSWLADFKIAEYNGEINLLLGYNAKLREIYSQLVPSKVDNHTFWNRYFFKVHLQELDKELLMNQGGGSSGGGLSSPKPTMMEFSPNSTTSGGEKDETWSMCSSANANEQQDLEGGAGDEGRESITPKLITDEDITSADEWDKVETTK